MIKFSVITVVKNRVSTIDKSIESILIQDYKNFEIIVIDGKSTDGTMKKLQSYKKNIKVLISENDDGVYHAMNKGLNYVTGDVVCFLNSDDFYANSKVFSSVANAFQNEKYDIVYGDIVYITQNKPSKIVRYWKNALVSKKSFLIGHHPPHPAFFAKKKFYDKYSNFKTNLIAADFDLMMTIFNKSKCSHYLKKICVVMRLGGISNKNINNIVSQNIQLIKIIKNHNQKSSVILFLLIKPLFRFSQFVSALIHKDAIQKAVTVEEIGN